MNIAITALETAAQAPMELLLEAEPSEKNVREYLAAGTCYIAESDGLTVGVILILPTRPKTVEIMNIAVKEEYRNRGIAKQLVKHAVDRIDRSKHNTVEIGTGNPGALQMLLYQKCGFRIIGIDFDYFRRILPEKIFVDGIECRDMIRMRMEL